MVSRVVNAYLPSNTYVCATGVPGECVVIDGGQWLRGAGEFNDLLAMPDSAWEAMESARTKKS